MEIVIWILTGGLVFMALLVVLLAGYVLQRNQRAPDQALMLMVKDLANVALMAKRSGPQHGTYRIAEPPEATPTPLEVALGREPAVEAIEDATDEAMQVARMGP